ncbi:tetratricopeptide repeat protein [Sphaerotilaceae bacterium SBD11-9]
MRRLLPLLLAALACHASAAPFTPPSDDAVVARLPVRLGSPDERHQQRLARAQLQHTPAQLPLALQLARAAIERARQLGDPRELGQAQAALAPWWPLPDPPPAARLLRATIKQSQHDFKAALTDLDALLPPHGTAPLGLQAQAELTRASVLQVTGRWSEAGAGCTRLASAHYAALGNAVQWPAQACLAELASLQGHADEAERTLRQLAIQAGPGNTWLTLVRAELAERRGDDAAQALYRQALQTPQPEVYALAAYADWLLAHARPTEVIALLAGREDADALLLRLAIAYRQSRDPRATAATAQLTERFDAAALRGDSLHAREQARYELELRGNAAAALRHAEANWAQQKEPADALLLARAARAAGQPQAAEPVRRLVRDTGWQDVRLKGLT